MKFACQTLFDITATGTTGHCKLTRMPFQDRAGQIIRDEDSWHRSRNQQRNWETVTQLISLRTQVDNLKEPQLINDRWCFEFEVENQNLFTSGMDQLSVLKADCAGVPMLVGLNESAQIGTVLSVDTNVWFALIE